jgi:hypothetical protein
MRDGEGSTNIFDLGLDLDARINTRNQVLDRPPHALIRRRVLPSCSCPVII